MQSIILTYSHSNGTFSLISKLVIISASSSEHVPKPNLVEAFFIFVSSWQCRFNSSIIAMINLNWQKYSLPSMYTSYNCMSFTGDLYSTKSNDQRLNITKINAIPVASSTKIDKSTIDIRIWNHCSILKKNYNFASCHMSHPDMCMWLSSHILSDFFKCVLNF